MKNYLILINNAPMMALYHKALGDKLEADGNKVFYAYTDSLPIKTFDIPTKPDNTYIFTSFFRDNFSTTSIPAKYQHINLWKTFFSDYDRNIVHARIKTHDRDYYTHLLANLATFFDNIITRHQIDICFYETISNSFAYVCYEVAKVNNVRYLGYRVSRLPNRFELSSEEFGNVDEFGEMLTSVDITSQPAGRIEEIETYLAKYSRTIPSYHPTNHPAAYGFSLLKKYMSKEKARLMKGAFRFASERWEKFYAYQINSPLDSYFSLFRQQVSRKWKVLRGKKYFDHITPEEPFFLMPLQMKPESSTSVLAKHYADDIAFIRNVAFNIPFGHKLYVKEHFVNFGRLPLSFYKALKEIPNLRLLSPAEPNKVLLDACSGVIALTSTMGFEALLAGKKVFTFGDVFYKHHMNSVNLDGFKNLHAAFLSPVTTEGLHDFNKKFLAAYYACTFEGDINYAIYPKIDYARFVGPMTDAINSLVP